MKRLMYLFYVIGAILLLSGCSEDDELTVTPDSAIVQSEEVSPLLKNAGKPAANLIGVMDLYFTFGDWEAGDSVWAGTVTFEDFGTYGMYFYHLSPFKGYSQASPFEEWFEIYELGTDPVVVVLAGPDVGVTTTANKPPEPCKYRMNGEIEVAESPFEGWLGRNVHMSGEITWQVLQTPDGPMVVPETAPGIFRIN